LRKCFKNDFKYSDDLPTFFCAQNDNYLPVSVVKHIVSAMAAKLFITYVHKCCHMFVTTPLSKHPGSQHWKTILVVIVVGVTQQLKT
jgi:hypothetical protein